MPRDFLAYWVPETVDNQIALGSHQNHAASKQFGRVSVGDTVWIVTVRKGRLRLVTRIVVEHLTDQDGAAQLIGCDAAQLWKAAWHIIGKDGTELPILDLDIQPLAQLLRFESAKDRLRLDDGVANAQQLQTMRILTPESAQELRRAAAIQ